jgi:hypothetical protein
MNYLSSLKTIAHTRSSLIKQSNQKATRFINSSEHTAHTVCQTYVEITHIALSVFVTKTFFLSVKVFTFVPAGVVML